MSDTKRAIADAVEVGAQLSLVVKWMRSKKRVHKQLALPNLQIKQLSFTALEMLIRRALLGHTAKSLMTGALSG